MPEPDEVYKWFSEGFTDYFAYQLLQANQLISHEEFAVKINKILRDYFLSSYFATDNQELIGNYWKNGALKQLSYQRGLFIALALDGAIREKGNGQLDNLIRTLYQDSKPGMIFSKEMFDRFCVRFAGEEMRIAIDSANAGKNRKLSEIFGGASFYRTTQTTITRRFDLGFNFDESKKSKKIVGLKKGSNAEQAGLAEGMEISNNFSIWNNNTEKPARVQVIQNGEKKWIEYVPAAPVNIQVPQIQ